MLAAKLGSVGADMALDLSARERASEALDEGLHVQGPVVTMRQLGDFPLELVQWQRKRRLGPRGAPHGLAGTTSSKPAFDGGS